MRDEKRENYQVYPEKYLFRSINVTKLSTRATLTPLELRFFFSLPLDISPKVILWNQIKCWKKKKKKKKKNYFPGKKSLNSKSFQPPPGFLCKYIDMFWNFQNLVIFKTCFLNKPLLIMVKIYNSCYQKNKRKLLYTNYSFVNTIRFSKRQC